MANKGEINRCATDEESGALSAGAADSFNRWNALVQVTRLLVTSGHPNLAFAAICVFVIPSATVAALLVALVHR